MMQQQANEQDLVACISPVINALSPLKLKQSTDLELNEFREQLINSFDEFERNCYTQQVTTSVMQEVKFALTAMCDEFVMSSGAHFRMDWMSRPLQLEFFGNNRAGEEFFERLAKLRTGGETKFAALEVYYICLQLGFEGIYKVKGIEQLKALIVDVRAQIEDVKGIPNAQLADNAVPAEGFAMKVGRNIPYWVILSICLGSIAALFAGFHFVISKQATQSTQTINNQVEVLTQLNKTNETR
ncbi:MULTISPECIES: type IVB secretion system protein IcmH/DotU [unclassified Pseudoalteromonas]|uniref:type IVB secretion system protein IcmH/DotU n=1 Tax=unclassified Pseudoalteromonas TaxID=194690 RepID=UPI0025B43BC7|nr:MULTISPECIES: type IVB secretion system protein IcmH/DotU [unclassified Pseudoalteromonas]MDN3380859.1 type IVB secretion system protein IcmH/DotU [Pseudoalteromonas sp. APC 3893]MDN3389266.1 type IVB secretion system protein IcmH/DotU [Pseudoalteromonas sp. APC 4017]